MWLFRRLFLFSLSPVFLFLPGTTAVADEAVFAIDDLVAHVLASNPELAIYEAEIEAAAGERRQAGRWANPEFSLEAGHQRISRGAGAAEGVAWAASVAQPIEFPGRLALRKAIADRNTELAEFGLDHFRRVLAAQVKVLGYSLYRTRTASDAAEDVAERARELTEVVLQREVGGISPLLESRILESSALTMEKRRQDARRAYQGALIEMNQLRDAPAATPVRLAEPPLEFPGLPPVEELVALAWQHSFEANARQVELEQQGFRVQLARNDRYPTIAVGPFVSRETAGERETVAGVGVSFALPVWDRNGGNVQAARARLRQAEASLLVLRRDLERRVVERALAYEASRKALLNLRPETLEEFRDAAGLAERHYRLGAIPINLYSETQAAYLDALDALLGIRQEAMESRLELEILTGPLKGPEEQK